MLVRYRQQVPLFHTQARIRVENDRLELLDNIFCYGVGCGESAGAWAGGEIFNAHRPIARHALLVSRALDSLRDLLLC
jgi:hypothetical protein